MMQTWCWKEQYSISESPCVSGLHASGRLVVHIFQSRNNGGRGCYQHCHKGGTDIGTCMNDMMGLPYRYGLGKGIWCHFSFGARDEVQVSWQPTNFDLVFRAPKSCAQSHVHSHMHRHVISHLIGHMIRHMIGHTTIGHVIWHHNDVTSPEGSERW